MKPEKDPHSTDQSGSPDYEPEVVNIVGLPWRWMTRVALRKSPTYNNNPAEFIHRPI